MACIIDIVSNSDEATMKRKMNHKDPWFYCTRKKKYATKHEAMSAGAMQELLTGTRLGVYDCPNCKQYHLTHKYAKGIIYDDIKAEVHTDAQGFERGTEVQEER